jgi:hypothetical protein
MPPFGGNFTPALTGCPPASYRIAPKCMFYVGKKSRKKWKIFFQRREAGASTPHTCHPPRPRRRAQCLHHKAPLIPQSASSADKSVALVSPRHQVTVSPCQSVLPACSPSFVPFVSFVVPIAFPFAAPLPLCALCAFLRPHFRVWRFYPRSSASIRGSPCRSWRTWRLQKFFKNSPFST